MSEVQIQAKFITIMQQYSGKRIVEITVPADPAAAVSFIIDHFNIPWKNQLEKSARIFINRQTAATFIRSGKPLQHGDQIAFIPISGGG